LAVNTHGQQQQTDEQAEGEQAPVLGYAARHYDGIPACCSFRLDRSLQVVKDRLSEEDDASICGEFKYRLQPQVQWKWALKHQQDTSPQTVIGALADGEDDDDFDDVDDDVAARIS
jgi:hypothetical protein